MNSTWKMNFCVTFGLLDAILKLTWPWLKISGPTSTKLFIPAIHAGSQVNAPNASWIQVDKKFSGIYSDIWEHCYNIIVNATIFLIFSIFSQYLLFIIATLWRRWEHWCCQALMLFTEQFPQHRAGEIARAVQRGARFIEAMTLGSIGLNMLTSRYIYNVNL